MENQPVLQVEHLTKHFPAGKKNVSTRWTT